MPERKGYQPSPAEIMIEEKAKKKEKMIKALERIIDIAKARLVAYKAGDPSGSLHAGERSSLLDSPEKMQGQIQAQLEKLTQKRRKQGLPELFYNPMSSDARVVLNGMAFPKHAKSLDMQHSGYGTSFESIAMHPMCVVTTENSPISEKTGAYTPEGAVLVFTHPGEVVRQISRYVEDIKAGRIDEFPAAAVTSIEDFIGGIESGSMPGDPKKP